MTAVTELAVSSARRREQTRARYPDDEGFVERDGVRLFYEVYGHGEPTVLLLPTWSIVHSRHWKMQIPYLARHCRVVAFDGRGNGRSDRPKGVRAPTSCRSSSPTPLAVMDAHRHRARDRSSRCPRGALWGPCSPPSIRSACSASPTSRPLRRSPAGPCRAAGHRPLRGAARHRRGLGEVQPPLLAARLRGLPRVLLLARCSTSRTRRSRSRTRWAGGSTATPETLADTDRRHRRQRPGRLPRALRARALPGARDPRQPTTRSARTRRAPRWPRRPACHWSRSRARATGRTSRDPVKVNLLLREFVGAAGAPPAQRWPRGAAAAAGAPCSSPRRSASATPGATWRSPRSCAGCVPDLEIDWLAQDPVTRGARGGAASASTRPAAELANESGHIESECRASTTCTPSRRSRAWTRSCRELHALPRRRAARSSYDLWIGDEAWEVDYYLHENPEQKRAAYVWLTDFVGWLPMTDGGEREAFLTADYNAEMIEHIARFPRVRDRAIFVGDADDIVPERFGAGLPPIRDWTERHYDFAGYVTGFEPRPAWTASGCAPSSATGATSRSASSRSAAPASARTLLRRVIAAFPEAKRLVPGLRMVVVAGPRIDPASLPRARRARGARPTSTTSTATWPPATSRSCRAGSPRRWSSPPGGGRSCTSRCATTSSRTSTCATGSSATAPGAAWTSRRTGLRRSPTAIAEEIGREVDYREVERDGAARAAKLIAELL